MKSNYTLNQIKQAAAKIALVPVALSLFTTQLPAYSRVQSPAAASAHQPQGGSANRPASGRPTTAAPANRPAAPASTGTSSRPGWNAQKPAGQTPGRPATMTGTAAPSRNVNANTNTNVNKNTNTNSNTNVNKNITINKNINVNQNTNTNKNVNVNQNTNMNRNANSNRAGSFNRPGTYVNRSEPVRPHSLAGDHRGGDVIRDHRGGDVIRHHRIPESHFRASFGRGHEFHLRRATLIGSAPIFRYGGIGFRLGRPWPLGWADTDPLYVDYVGGSYYLCNRLRPEARVLVNVAECDTCQVVEAPAPAPCDTCEPALDPNAGAPAPAAPPTLVRGMTIGQVMSILGSPKEVVDLGVRKIFLYDSMRVTFYAGRMTDAR